MHRDQELLQKKPKLREKEFAVNLWETFVTVMSQLGASNMLARRSFIKLVGMPIFVHNPIYSYAYKRQMLYVMKKYSQNPQEVAIENTNACNLRCITCPHSKMRRSVGFMDKELYKKIIDECVQLKIRHVSLGGFGEPLLDSSFIDKVIYAKQGVEYLSTITNGMLLTQELGKELVKSGLDLLRVSIDAATSKTYTKVRPPGKLEIVEENLRKFIEVRDQQKKGKPIVEVRFVPTPENIHEIAIFKKK
ncbi:GTP 3',8-cyclase [subsurface metagenome]